MSLESKILGGLTDHPVHKVAVEDRTQAGVDCNYVEVWLNQDPVGKTKHMFYFPKACDHDEMIKVIRMYL